ncbi:MAG: hypothetical protein ACFFCE_05180 [Promethearchaeota archaeon]
MKIETLIALLDIQNRHKLFNKILKELERTRNIDYVSFQTFETTEGIIPLLKIAKNSKIEDIKHVKVFIGAQHNEYNGLFSILKFFQLINKEEIKIDEVVRPDQILFFLPLLNPYGFLNPKRNNKSGYYLKNGMNLNRFWRRAFAPEYNNGMKDLNRYSAPPQVNIVKKLLQKYWKNEDIYIYILDFHETSLLERFLADLSEKLNLLYKFDHWLKEGIIFNIIKLYGISYSQKPLFVKKNPSVDYRLLKLTQNQFELVIEKLVDYISKNKEKDKLPFYFCYSNKSKEYCLKLANIVYNKLKEKLWETCFPAFSHNFINHGCFVKMSDATPRPKVYSMELESRKHFFNIFEEIKNSKSVPNYLENKLKSMNVSIELALETLKEMIELF